VASWDRLSAGALSKLQDRLVAHQVQHVVGPFSPYWKARLAELGRRASTIGSVAALEALPAAGERDVAPDGDPAGMARLVVQASEGGFVLHAKGPTVRRVLRMRATGNKDYLKVIAHETKPTSYVWSGLGFRYPLASTRADLDVVARAGARLWSIAGLTAQDALLSAVPVTSSTEHLALSYAAMAAGAPALFPGAEPAALIAAARLAPPTVLAAPSPQAADVLSTLAGAGVSIDSVRTLLLVGAPTPAQRAAVAGLLPAVTVLAVHAPAGARVLWTECRAGGAAAGLHTYPDLDLVQMVDPDSGEPTAQGGEVVLTQLGMFGSALLRWRTGDIAAAPIDSAPCPGCGRRVPRVIGLKAHAMVLVSDDGRTLDLRAVAGALSGRTDLTDWRVVVGRRGRDGRGQVIVHLLPDGEPGEVAVAAATDIRTVAGLLPTQLVVTTPEDLAALPGEALTPRIRLRD
jgi:phenylacetate-coenzyme A ligase PaaK-like adenylate-forming protein